MKKVLLAIGVLLGMIALQAFGMGEVESGMTLAMPVLVPSFTGVTTKKNIKVEELVTAIEIMNDTEVTNEEITVELKAGDGSFETLIPSLPLKLLFEYASQGEGLFHKKLGTAINSQKSRGRVIIGVDGGLPLDGQQYLNVNLSSLTSGRAYVVNTVQDDVEAEDVVRWEKDALNADRGTRSVDDKETLVLPVSNFEKIDLVYEADEDGQSQTVTYELDDLISDAIIKNDIVCVDNDGTNDFDVRGYLDHFFIDLEGVSSFYLKASATNYSFYTVALLGVDEIID